MKPPVNIKYRQFNWSTLYNHNYSKGQLYKAMGFEKYNGFIDTALPSNWMHQFYYDNETLKRMKKEGIGENMIYFSTFMVYEDGGGCGGRLVSGCKEVSKFLKKYNYI